MLLTDFSQLPNLELNADEEVRVRMHTSADVFMQTLREADQLTVITRYHDAASACMVRIDRVLNDMVCQSPDRATYSFVVHLCTRQLIVLENAIEQLRRGEDISVPECAAAMALLEGYMKGLLFIAQAYEESAAVA